MYVARWPLNFSGASLWHFITAMFLRSVGLKITWAHVHQLWHTEASALWSLVALDLSSFDIYEIGQNKHTVRKYTNLMSLNLISRLFDSE